MSKRELQQPDLDIDIARWTSIPYWTWEEAEYLLAGIDYWKVRQTSPEVPLDLRDIDRRMIREAFEFVYRDHSGPRRLTPEEAVALARRMNIQLPTTLAHALEDKGKVLPMEPAKEPRQSSDDAGLQRKHNKVLKLLLAVAIAQYRYKPSALRQDAISHMLEDAADMGIQIDDQTIRKRLREAFEVLSAEEQRNVANYVVGDG